MSQWFPAQTESELLFTIYGLVLLLGGWIIFRVGTRLAGVALGVGFGFFIGEVLNVVLHVDRTMGLYVTIGCSIIGALGAIFMIKAVTNFLFATAGFLFGALLGRLGAEIYADWHQVPFTLDAHSASIILPAALVTALLAVFLQRLIMILVTSFMGATFLIAGVPALTQPWAFPAVLAGGIFWQGFVLSRIFRRRKPRPAPERPRNRRLVEDE